MATKYGGRTQCARCHYLKRPPVGRIASLSMSSYRNSTIVYLCERCLHDASKFWMTFLRSCTTTKEQE